MKGRFTFPLLLLLPFALPAQDLTGIWRGSFANDSRMVQEKYKYEIQINQLSNNSLKGVTYSYSYGGSQFYGKADLQGIFMDKTGNLIFKENKMLEFKVSDPSSPCLMTCYLQYRKENGIEYLEGTYSSIVTLDQSDCGSGKVSLRRVENTDFVKEDFLLKKKKGSSSQRIKPGADSSLVIYPPVAKKPVPKKAVPSPLASTKPAPGTNQPPVASGITRVRPGQATAGTKGALALKKRPAADSSSLKPMDSAIALLEKPRLHTLPPSAVPEKKTLPVPAILNQRENKLVKTIFTSSPDIRVQLYDNGEVDDDTITVYHNHALVAYRKRLSENPIVFNLTTEPGEPVHELVMVADNLGRIPPNTALMIVTTGGKRYELFITSNEQRNAKVIIEYKMPANNMK